MEKRARAIVQDSTLEAGKVIFCADLELDFPSAIGVRVLHPELKYAKFGDDGVETDRYHLPRWTVLESRNLDFKHALVLKVTFGVGKVPGRAGAGSSASPGRQPLCSFIRSR